jgi:DNA-binding GntR family transcriptional regulator
MTHKQKIPLKTIIYKEIRNDIAFGNILPGEHLKESRLTSRFACSRGPIREAFNMLEKEGFLQLIPNQGALVTRISVEDIRDSYSLLALLEGQAVEWATPLLKPKDVNYITKINNSLKNINPRVKSAVEEWVPLNAAFHQTFRKHCNNSKMDWIVEEIRCRISRYLYTSLMVPTFDEYIKDHELIIQSVIQGNPRQARKQMEKHINRACDVLTSFFSYTVE